VEEFEERSPQDDLGDDDQEYASDFEVQSPKGGNGEKVTHQSLSEGSGGWERHPAIMVRSSCSPTYKGNLSSRFLNE